MRNLVNCKTPHFFIYAKDKLPSQVEPINNSTVNRLLEIIPKYRFKYNKPNGGKFDYHMLMDNPLLIITPHVEQIISKYKELTSSIHCYSFKDENGDDTMSYQIDLLRDKLFAEVEYKPYLIDAIIYGQFSGRSSPRKVLLWCLFGDYILANLKKNIAKQNQNMTLCGNCYTRYENNSDTINCPYCGKCV